MINNALSMATFIQEWKKVTEQVRGAAKKRGVNLARISLVAKER